MDKGRGEDEEAEIDDEDVEGDRGKLLGTTSSMAYELNASFPPTATDNHKKMEESVGNCPVCCKPFLAKDLDHVLALVGLCSSQLSDEVNDEEKLLQSEDEIIRRQKFETILNLQKENSGLIEPKRDIVILPGMYLPQPVAIPSSTSTKESDEQQQEDPPAVVSGKHAGRTSNGPSSSRPKNFGARRQKARSDHHSSSTVKNSRKPVQQWFLQSEPACNCSTILYLVQFVGVLSFNLVSHGFVVKSFRAQY
ncbi:hypothetical protein CR513_62403, partial [Mucuna pruriens]